jgi:hypothetical protein
VPFDKIRYDNLKSAVQRVLFGRNRTESDRWVLFRSHMGFDAFYCQPGVGGAHEKGGVEGEGGRFRRTHLVPVPKVDSLAQLNARLLAADRSDDHRRITHRVRTVGQDFALEAPLLRPLPSEVFETGLSLQPLVDRYARITVRQSTYSVPARFIGRRIRVLLSADEVIAFDRRQELARHERSTVKGSTTVVLDHYLEILRKKPGALAGPRRCPEPASPVRSPPSTKRSGPLPAATTATPRAPVSWSRCCCCTATCPTVMW